MHKIADDIISSLITSTALSCNNDVMSYCFSNKRVYCLSFLRACTYRLWNQTKATPTKPANTLREREGGREGGRERGREREREGGREEEGEREERERYKERERVMEQERRKRVRERERTERGRGDKNLRS